MRKISKRLKIAKEKIEQKPYSAEAAISLLKEISTAKFIESVEAHISLNLNPKYADQQLRSTVVLPYGTGREIRVAALVANEKSPEWMDCGAELIGSENLMEEINKGILNFDLLIAEPEIMPKIAKLGKILGPKGLMPSPKSGTVTKEIKKTVQEFKKGKLEYKIDKTGILHINFGKVNFSENNLLENLKILYKSILINKPSGVKGKYFKKFSICPTMGPSIEIDLSFF